MLLCKTNRSVYIEQNNLISSFTGKDSWTIMSPMEQNIRKKIQSCGVALSDWNLAINYGIKTGCNDAFIISSRKKDELIAADPKSAELIRPILRGRDVKRYGFSFADQWIIATFPSCKYDIDQYPAIKQYFLSFGIERLEQTGATHIIDGVPIKSRKKTNNKWFETQDSISYWNEFFKQKIVYREISDNMNACMVESGIMLNNKCYIITGDHLIYILSFLNSKIFAKIILPEVNAVGGKGEAFLSKISLVRPSTEMEERLHDLYHKRMEGNSALDEEEIDRCVDEIFCSLYELSGEERQYILL